MFLTKFLLASKFPNKKGTFDVNLVFSNLCHIVLPASTIGERVFHQMFLNLVGNIFALREATLVSAIKANVSRYGIQGNI
jgi:hypothetical protein